MLDGEIEHPARESSEVDCVAMPPSAPERRRVPIGTKMPLATGRSALAALTTTVGLVQLVAFGPFFIPEVPDWVPRWVSGVFVIVWGCLWAVWFFAIVGSLMEARKRRCSDVIMGESEGEIVGGRANGLRGTWTELRCKAETGQKNGAPWGVLRIQGAVVAESTERDEVRSFQALAETLSAMGKERPPPPVTEAARVLACDQCGAPVPPSPEARVTCRHCGAAVTVPEGVRSRFAAADGLRDARDRAGRLLSALVRQPGARFTNLVLVLGAPPLLLGFPLTALLFNELFVTRHLVRASLSPWLFACATGFSLGLYLWLRAQVAGREAIRFIAFHYGARHEQDDTWACRICGAPLALEGEPESYAVVPCRYCRSENVIGIDLARDAAEAGGHSGELEVELRARLARRTKWRAASASAVVLFAVSGAALAAGVAEDVP